MLPENFPWWIVGALFLIGMGGAFCEFLFYRALRDQAPVEWEKLGRPHYYRKRTGQEQLRIFRYRLCREYSKLSSVRITMLGDLTLLSGVLVLALFIYLSIFAVRYDYL